MKENFFEKTLYVCDEHSISEYHVKFEKNEVNAKINDLFNKKLESYYTNDERICSQNSSYSYIKSSYDLVAFLKKTLFEEPIINLSEIRTLIKSNNSPMRTPQTLIAISEIFTSFDYLLINQTDLTNYELLIKYACRKGIDYKHDLIDIASKNQEVLNNLRIHLSDISNLNHPKTITM